MENADLLKIKDMLTDIASYIDKHIDKHDNSCFHEGNIINLTTMGSASKKFKCCDCGKIWEEAFVDEEREETLGTK